MFRLAIAALLALANPSLANTTFGQAPTAKGTQGATALPVQSLKDAGRTFITWTLNVVGSTQTAEGLITMQRSSAGAALAGSVNYTITSGKTLRITNAYLALEAAGTNPKQSRARLRIRQATGGSCSTASPLQTFMVVSSSGPVGAVSQVQRDFIDGNEFFGNGTNQLCFTLETPDWVTGTNAANISADIDAFEY